MSEECLSVLLGCQLLAALCIATCLQLMHIFFERPGKKIEDEQLEFEREFEVFS